MKLRIELPTKETPGYWKRVKSGVALREEMKDGLTVSICDRVMAFILPYVTEPADRTEAQDLLENLSQIEFEKIIKSITGDGGGNETAVPPQNTPPLENTSSPTD